MSDCPMPMTKYEADIEDCRRLANMLEAMFLNDDPWPDDTSGRIARLGAVHGTVWLLRKIINGTALKAAS